MLPFTFVLNSNISGNVFVEVAKVRLLKWKQSTWKFDFKFCGALSIDCGYSNIFRTVFYGMYGYSVNVEVRNVDIGPNLATISNADQYEGNIFGFHVYWNVKVWSIYFKYVRESISICFERDFFILYFLYFKMLFL